MNAKELKKEREDLGLTIREMAEALNTPFGTYYKWETGKRRVAGIVKVALVAVKSKTKAKK